MNNFTFAGSDPNEPSYGNLNEHVITICYKTLKTTIYTNMWKGIFVHIIKNLRQLTSPCNFENPTQT